MPGLRLRAHSQANPISATPLSPLNARSTTLSSSSSSTGSSTTLIPALFFVNHWSSIINGRKSPVVVLVQVPGQTSIGRTHRGCIENVLSSTNTTTTTATSTVSSLKAKAKVAVRATVVAAVAAVAAFTAWTLLHFFVRGSTRLAANLIVVLLHDSNPRHLFPSHIGSPFPPSSPSPSIRLSSLLFQPSPQLPLPLKEALVTCKSPAKASLQTCPPRPDSYSTVPRRRLLGGLPRTIFPTASHARIASTSPEPATVDASENPRLATLSQQPKYPGASPDLESPVAAAGLPHGHSPSLLHNYDPKDYFLQSPFRNRAASSAARRIPHLSSARLWNPTNSTPRLPEKPIRKRRPSTPPPPAVTLSHPTLDPHSVDPSDPLGVGAGDYPLLTLPEQRQTRHSTSTRNSLQVDRRSGNAEHRISLPRSIRHSYDGRRSGDPSPTFADPDFDPTDPAADTSVNPRVTRFRKRGQSISNPAVKDFAVLTFVDKGKGKAAMDQSTEGHARGASKDLERGPDVLPRLSNVSAGDGIGSAISSSNSSIMGEELPPDLGEEWGPQHPCFPHLNPHVPLDSLEYQNTRIIRIRRDWLLEGDLAPTFSNLYPEILDPAGLSEQEFRRIIDKLNGELIPIFSPYNWRNVVDSVLGLVTGWLWDDLGFTGVKARLKRLERWVDQWNKEMEKAIGNDDSSMAPRIISLRRTGYMTLDIQIPDPEIAPAPSTPAGSGNMSMEPPPAAVMA